MRIVEQVEKEIREQYSAGATQEELAKQFGLSQQHIQQLLSGQRKWSGISIGNIEKMFPAATLNIHGNVTGTASSANGTAIGINNGHCSDSSAIQNKILNSSELTDAEKIKVMKVILQ